MRCLMRLIEQRREMVGDKTRFTNRLRNTLKQYYPQTLEWFEHIDTIIFCAFISRWPTLSAIKHAHRKTLEDFFHSHIVVLRSGDDRSVTCRSPPTARPTGIRPGSPATPSRVPAAEYPVESRGSR